MVTGEPGSSLAIETVPNTEPNTVGEKITFNVATLPGTRRRPGLTPLVTKPVPETVTFDIVMGVEPEFVSVKATELLVPTTVLPKSRCLVLNTNWLDGGWTKRTAALLRVLPIESLMSTVNWPPVEAEVV